jgi:CelD/BcsL family acetyltransferase involved in cellulose biosynthesis
MTTELSRALAAFLKTYGGKEYKSHTCEEMIQVLEGLISILGLSGSSLVIATRLLAKLRRVKAPEVFVMKVSEEMFLLEGLGVER